MLRDIQTEDRYTGGKRNGHTMPSARKMEANWSDDELEVYGLERYTPPPPEPSEPEPVNKLEIELERHDLRMGLLALGVTDIQIEAAINNLPEKDNERAEAWINWQDPKGGRYSYQHPLVGKLMTALNLDEDAAKATWIAMVERNL